MSDEEPDDPWPVGAAVLARYQMDGLPSGPVRDTWPMEPGHVVERCPCCGTVQIELEHGPGTSAVRVWRSPVDLALVSYHGWGVTVARGEVL